ncbi:hypothetical protein PINS_up010589 [Pythium insidiosum]|nr:hypothetical protein PINS_up010589 [Pythium insidiosum]
MPKRDLPRDLDLDLDLEAPVDAVAKRPLAPTVASARSKGCGPRRWLPTLVLYAPCLAAPLAARAIALMRQAKEMPMQQMLQGVVFGVLQDSAVLLQALLLIRVALGVRCALVAAVDCCTGRPLETDDLSWREWLCSKRFLLLALVQLITGLLLCAVYVCATLACVVDLALQVQYLPRLNRGFIAMYISYSDQFSSSLSEVMTPLAIAVIVVYAVVMLLWVVSLLCDALPLPTLDVITCWSRPSPSSATANASNPRSASLRSPFVCLVDTLAISVTTRTTVLCIMVFVFALHASLGLDGSGNDLYLFSNAMYWLETEPLLRAPTQSHATLLVENDEADVGVEIGHARHRVHPIVRRLLGDSEDYELPPQTSWAAKYPFWRKTKGYHGPKRFDIRYNSSYSASTQPPNIILINMESFRSLDVGVIGARAKKAATNQTVTPFFDQLSESGVLFRQHYTPCVQTSRTLLTTLFGMMPSLTDWSALATYRDKGPLHVHGLPHILKKQLNYENVFWSAVSLGWENWSYFLPRNGFDLVVDKDHALRFLPKTRRDALTDDDSFSWGRHDKVSLEALEHFLEQRQQLQQEHHKATQPLFLDVYTISSHDPWVLPKSFTPSTNYSTFITEGQRKVPPRAQLRRPGDRAARDEPAAQGTAAQHGAAARGRPRLRPHGARRPDRRRVLRLRRGLAHPDATGRR